MPAATRVRIKGTRVYIDPVETRSLDAAAGGYRWENARTLPNLNSAIFTGAVITRQRGAYYARNNPWVTKGIDALVSNMIGTGITPQSQHPNAEVRKALHARFLQWTDEADAAGLTDFYGLQSVAARSMIEKGECFARLRPRQQSDGLSVPFQLELIPPEQVPMDLHRELANGVRIRAGIEYDALGRRAAYHVFRNRPDEGMSMSGSMSTDLVRVPAEDMVHLFDPLEAGQVRGLSRLAPILLRLHDLDAFEDAALVKQKIAALFTAIMVDPEGSGKPLTGNGKDASPSMEPGSIIAVPPGKDIRFSDPPDSTDYSPFVKSQLRAVSAGLGLTYEQLSGDLEGVNYSSIRAGLVEFRRRITQIQHSTIIFQLCRPVWGRFIRLGALSGALPIPEGADLVPYLAVKWLPPRWEYVDPQKDIKAEIMAMDARLKSRTQCINERGESPELVDAEIAADLARETSLGLPPRTPFVDQAPNDPSQQESNQ